MNLVIADMLINKHIALWRGGLGGRAEVCKTSHTGSNPVLASIFNFSNKSINMNKDLTEKEINLNPIRRGGFISPTVKDFAIKYLDGYSICDTCKGWLEDISHPPLCKISDLLLSYYPMDRSIMTFGAREAMSLVIKTVVPKGGTILVDSNRHYSSVLAIESAGASLKEVESSGHPEYKIDAEAYRKAIQNNKEKPDLILLTHVDGNWGNLVDAKAIGEIAQEFKIPFLLNAAYSAGRFKFNPAEMYADFVAISGHKSFGSTGPVGAILYKDKWADRIERKSTIYPVKNLNILGCTVRGVASAAFYQALVELEDRLNRWETEIENTRYFVKQMENITDGGIVQVGEKPKMHDLICFETPILYEIGEKHQKKGYFLYNELKKRGITGIKPGRTKGFKVSVYGLTREEIDYVINSFNEIIHE